MLFSTFGNRFGITQPKKKLYRRLVSDTILPPPILAPQSASENLYVSLFS